jgi:hypothetical protein
MPMTLLAALLLAQAQEPPVTTGSDRGSAVRLQVTGHLDLHYLYRSNEIDRAGGTLNSLVPVPAAGSDNFWAGRISLRTDVEVKDFVTGVIEIENRSFEQGMNKPFGADPPDSPVEIRQGYIDIGQFLASSLNVRIGVQNVVFKNRPQDEPFFMDLGESEGFFRGFSAASGSIGNTVDREIGQPVGVRFFYTPFEIMTVQAFWIVYGEGGGTPHDESIYGLVANSLLGENWSAWLLFAVVAGGRDRLEEVVTVGLGIDGYLGDDKSLELFVEGYLQGGTLRNSPSTVRKRANAGNVGARYFPCACRKLWLETAVAHRSGDRRGGDDRDQAFQSYENVNRFLVMESAEFGLDIDTNVRSVRLAVGVGPFDVDGRPLRIQVDVARFRAVTSVQAAGRDWGTETDLGLTWNYNESLNLAIKAGWLADSELLRRLAGDHDGWLLVFGADLRF